MPERHNKNWIKAFIEYTQDIPAPLIFKKWAAISVVAAVLERKVWYTSVFKDPLYPNMYMMFLAPPGVGKGVILKRAFSFWNALNGGDEKGSDSIMREREFCVAPTNATSASLLDDLKKAKRIIYTDTGESMRFNALTIASEELGAFLPGYDLAMMNNLTTLYDASQYSESRRGEENMLVIKRPVLNILAGAPPVYLSDVMPETAWEQGFMSRTLIVFSNEQSKIDLLRPLRNTDKAESKLLDDLRQIHQLQGPIKITREALELNQKWLDSGLKPKPKHPKLQNYCTRRNAHMTKIAMTLVAAEGPRLVIEPRHISAAINELNELEASMQGLFSKLKTSSDHKIMSECWHYVSETSAKIGAPIPEKVIRAWLSERVPAYNLEKMLKVMVDTGMLIPSTINKLGTVYTAHERKLSVKS